MLLYEICHHVGERFGSTVFTTFRITIRFNKACSGAIFTHRGRVWLGDVSLPRPCHSIVQLKYTTETQPWTTLKELLLHCLLHFNTSVNTRFTFSCRSSVAFKTTERQHFPVFYCHPKATDAQLQICFHNWGIIRPRCNMHRRVSMLISRMFSGRV